MNIKCNLSVAFVICFLSSLIPFGLSAQRIKNYSTKSGLNSDNVYDIQFDKFGRIWFATDKGLNILNGNKVIPIKQYSHCTFLKFLPGNKIFYGATDNNFLIKIVDDSLTQLWKDKTKVTDNFIIDKVTAMIALKDSIYVSNGNLNLVTNGELKIVMTPGPFSYNGDAYSYQKEFNTINVFFREGVDGFTFVINNRPVNEITGNLKFLNIPFDFNSLWHIGHCFSKGVNYFVQNKTIYSANGKTWFCSFIENSDQIISITSVEGVFFLGTAKGKVFKYNPYNNKYLDIFRTSKVITSIKCLTPSELWIATEGAGVYYIDIELTPIFPNLIGNINKIILSKSQYFGISDNSLVDAVSGIEMDKYVPLSFQITEKYDASFIDTTRAVKNYLLKFVCTVDDSIYLTAFHSGLTKFLVQPNGIFKEQVSRYLEKFTCGLIVDKTTSLLGSSNGLYTYNYRKELDFKSHTVNDTSNFFRLEIPLINRAKINSICHLANDVYLVSAKGLGVGILNLHMTSFKLLDAIKQPNINHLIKFRKDYILAVADNLIYTLKFNLLTSDFIIVSIKYVEGINSIALDKNNIIISTKEGVYRMSSNSLLHKKSAQIGHAKVSYKFNWDDRIKNIYWHCSSIPLDQSKSLYILKLSHNNDTQFLYTSDNYLNLKKLCWWQLRNYCNVKSNFRY